MRVPKPRKRGSTYSISVYHNKQRFYFTGLTEKECIQWAEKKILEFKYLKEVELPEDSISLLDLIYKYYDEVGQYTKSKKWISDQIKCFKTKFIGLYNKAITQITAKDLTQWRKQRLTKVKPNTVLKELALLSSMYNYAIKELHLLDINPVLLVSKPAKPIARNRRITTTEINILLTALNYKSVFTPVCSAHWVGWIFLFALETAMRRSEILNMEFKHVHSTYVYLPTTKNGTARSVPLSNQAKKLLSVIPRTQGKVVNASDNALRLRWERTKSDCRIPDLHFHDTRHEAITRMVLEKQLPVETLAKITGHKDIKVLINTYYNPTAQELVRLFNGE